VLGNSLWEPKTTKFWVGPAKKSTNKSKISDNWPPGAEDASRNDDETADPEKRILSFSAFVPVAKKVGVQGCALTLWY